MNTYSKMAKRKIRYEYEIWGIYDGNERVGCLQRTHNGKYWTFTIKGVSRSYDNFSDARAYAYNF